MATVTAPAHGELRRETIGLPQVGWVVGGIVLTAFVPRRIIDNVDQLFVEEEMVGIAGPTVPPEPLPGPAPA